MVTFFLAPCFAEREKIVSLKNVRGEFSITSDIEISMKDAKEKAREEAKRNALSQVCGEKINIWDKIEISSVGESFNSLSVKQVDGEIADFEIIEEGQQTNPVRKNEIVFYCVANIKVKKGTEPDPTFAAKIDGIKTCYFNQQGMECTITPTQDAYLRVFLFEDAQIGYSLYPKNIFESRFIPANTKVLIPGNGDEFVMYTSKSIETNILVFVLTKQNIPFYLETMLRNDIEKWIAKIPNDQKYLYFTSINIIKQ